VKRFDFVFLAQEHPHTETNGGAQYAAGDEVKARIDRVNPAGAFPLSHFTVDSWIDRIKEFRRNHYFPRSFGE